MNETAEGLGEFVIAGCEASRVLETIEATFDAIPQSVIQHRQTGLESIPLLHESSEDSAVNQHCQ